MPDHTKLVSKYARMWPREVFYIPEEPTKRLLLKQRVPELTEQSGVYILYRDDVPYYIGKAEKLWNRLHSHANISSDSLLQFLELLFVFSGSKGAHERS
jgi:hypothetical protein